MPNCGIEVFTQEQIKTIANTPEDKLHYLDEGQEIEQKEYELVEKEFDGIVVGSKRVYMKKYYYNDGKSEYIYGDDLQDVIKSRKKKEDIQEVVKVSYGLNHTRIVPIEKVIECND